MKQVLELFTTLLAFGIGLFFFQKLNTFFRLLFTQVSVYLLIECFAISIGRNAWLYNLMMPVETGLLFYSAEVYFKTVKSKVVINCLYVVFLVIYLADVLYFIGFDKFANHAAIIEGFFMTAIYTFLLYEILMNRPSQKLDMPATLASLGMVVYFACTVPYLCVIAYFQDQDSHLNDLIFQYLIISLASLRYLLIAIAFYKAGTARIELLEPINKSE